MTDWVGAVLFSLITLSVAALLFHWIEAPRVALQDLRYNIGGSLLRAILRLAPNERVALERLVDGTQNIQALLDELTIANSLRNTRKQIERVWADQNSSEKDCVELLAKNLPLFFPEFRKAATSEVWVGYSITRILRELYGLDSVTLDQNAKKYGKFLPRRRKMPDIFGKFDVVTPVSIASQRGIGEVFLLVEAKKPSVPCSQSVMDEAFNYASDMLRLADSQMSGVHFECFAVAGDFANRRRLDPIRRVADNGRGSITVTPVTWADLYERIVRLPIVRLDGATDSLVPIVNPKRLFEEDAQEADESDDNGIAAIARSTLQAAE